MAKGAKEEIRRFLQRRKRRERRGEEGEEGKRGRGGLVLTV
jgi:hypothetical protein